MTGLAARAGAGVGTGGATSEGVGAFVSFGSSVLTAIFAVEVEVEVLMEVEEEDDEEGGEGEGEGEEEAEGLGVGLVIMMVGLEGDTLSLDALRLLNGSEDGETGGRRAEGSKRGSAG